jgi:hypothetical protein
MKQWHAEHMQKTVVKYVKGLSENASAYEKRNHKKYCGLASVCRQLEYGIKHGVTAEEVSTMLHKVRHHSSFSEIHDERGESMARLEEIEIHFKEFGRRRGTQANTLDLT